MFTLISLYQIYRTRSSAYNELFCYFFIYLSSLDHNLKWAGVGYQSILYIKYIIILHLNLSSIPCSVKQTPRYKEERDSRQRERAASSVHVLTAINMIIYF